MRKLTFLTTILLSLVVVSSASAYEMELTSPSDGQTFNTQISPFINSFAVDTTFTVSGFEDEGELELQYFDNGNWIMTVPYEWTSNGDGTASITTAIPALAAQMQVRAVVNCDDEMYCEEECDYEADVCYAAVAGPITLNLNLPKQRPLSSRLGKLRIGMSLKQARKATNIKLFNSPSPGCRYGEATKYGISVMFLKNKVARFDADRADYFYLKSGINIGMNQEQFLAKARKARKIGNYPGAWQYQFPISKGIYGQVVGYDNNGIRNIDVGTKKATSLIEGCL